MENVTEQQPISRKDFIRSLGLSGAALMAMYCMGGLSACSKKEDDAQPTPNTGTKLDISLNLDEAANADLKTNGGYIYKDSLIIARTTAGTYVAVAKACTHQGTTVVFQSGDQFHCNNHGSNFGADGSVKNGPATTALKKYSTAVSGSTLRVFEA